MERIGIWGGVLVAISLVGACGNRPDGEYVDGEVQITATATADGVPLGSAGITASLAIEVTGTMTDMFGVEASTYSWSGGPVRPLELDDSGAFVLDLTLQEDDNTLVLEGTSVVGDAVSTLELVYTRDGQAPVIELPSAAFAASIIGEGEMEMDKQSTTFTLSGGVATPMRDGVSFSKYSSTWGEDQPNLPVWRFNLQDNHALTDARMDFRIFREGGETEDELVAWTPAALGEDSDFEVVVNSTLNERIASESGEFLMELRAYDSAGLESKLETVSWNQSVLNPPIFLATGSESIMGNPGGERDPRSYVLGDNFAGIASQEHLIVGSVLVGNPNDVPVLVELTSVMEPLASYSFQRTFTAITLSVAPPQGLPCGTGNTEFETRSCMGQPSDWARDPRRRLRQVDGANREPSYEIRDAGSNVVATSPSFVMPPNSEFFAMVTLNEGPSNLLSNLEDHATFGPFVENVTTQRVNRFFNCSSSSGGSCLQWDVADDYNDLLQYFATWEFTTTVSSKVNLDINETTEFLLAHDGEVAGYSRVLATGNTTTNSFPNPPIPTSHDDLVGF